MPAAKVKEYRAYVLKKTTASRLPVVKRLPWTRCKKSAKNYNNQEETDETGHYDKC